VLVTVVFTELVDMARVVRARYERGVLRPLEKLDLREGEEVRIVVLPKDFSELVEEIEVEAREDIDKVLREGRERWVEWY
jgi:Protein of unknown function DUF104.